MKIIKILLSLFFFQLASCQNKSAEMPSGFVVDGDKLYYNSREIALGMPIEKFVDAFGKYDRISVDSSGGVTNKTWYWAKIRGEAYENEENKIVYINPYVDDVNEKEYNSLKDLVDILGNYDSIAEIKSPLRINKRFIWDDLGITLAADGKNNEIIGNIHIQTLHPIKHEKLILDSEKTFEQREGQLYIPISKEQIAQGKKDIEYLKNVPKKEYSGNFTYKGKTINLKKIGYTGWQDGIRELGIEGSDYNPPGDSPAWSRWIRESYDMYITIDRYSNENAYRELSPEKVGDIDYFKSIVIWWHRDYDEENENN